MSTQSPPPQVQSQDPKYLVELVVNAVFVAIEAACTLFLLYRRHHTPAKLPIIHITAIAILVQAVRAIDPSGVYIYKSSVITNFLLHDFVTFCILEASFIFIIIQTSLSMWAFFSPLT